MPDENPAESYIVVEDISLFNDDSTVYVVSITDLQRNITNPLSAPRKLVKKTSLNVIAEDLTSYVESWNEAK